MKRIGVSVVLCSALAVAGEVATTDLIADFGNNSGGTDKHYTATKGSSGENPILLNPSVATENKANYGTDWTGSTSNLTIKTDDLTFTFTATASGTQSAEVKNYNNLLIQDGFTFSAQNNTSKVTIKNGDSATGLGRTENKLTSITFGADSENKTITIGNKMALNLVDFTKVIVSGHLMVGQDSSFSSGNAELDITGGITLNNDAQLLTANTINNNGVITMLEGSSIQAKDKLTISTTNDPAPKPDRIGAIINVKGNATIYASNGTTQPPQNPTLSIEGQKINITEGKTLTLASNKATEGSSGTLTLGGATPTLALGETSKATSFQGGTLKLEGFTELQSKDVSFNGVKIESTTLKTLKNTKLSLTNTALSTTGDLTITKDASSEFFLNGNNSITATKSVAKNGGGSIVFNGSDATHTFSGNGRLDLNADTSITFGDSTTPAQISLLQSQGNITLGLNSPEIKFENLKVSNLTLEVLGANNTIKNKSLELGDSTLQGKGERLVIENGDGSSGAKITITDNKSATIAGKEIAIYGQSIEVGKTNGGANLTLSANEGKGILILGKSAEQAPSSDKVTILANEAGKVGILGKANGTPTSSLTLQASEVQYGELELKDLKITTQATSPSAGLTFVGSDKDSKLTLDATNGGISITAGNGVDSYQSLNFGVKATTENKGFQSSININKTATLKASMISFIDQKVSLTTMSGGANLELYALGFDGKADNGAFSFVNTSFTNGSSAEIKLATNKGASLFASGLVLDGVNLTSYKVANGSTRNLSAKASLDLSASETSNDPSNAEKRTPSLTALGGVKIEAEGIYSGVKQIEGETTKEEKIRGIGMDIQVGNAEKTGQLVIKDTASVNTSGSGDPTFVIGGVLTIDNTQGTSEGGVVANGASRTNGASTLEIQMGTNQAKATDSTLEIEMGSSTPSGGASGEPYKLSTQTLALQIDGGIVAIGKDGSGKEKVTSGITIKAKSFTFGKPTESKETQNPNDFSLKVYTTTLTLDTKQNEAIEIKGLTYLEGTSTTQAELKTKKTNGALAQQPQPEPAQVATAGLKLHDLTAKGKASITDQLSFVDSNIKVIGTTEASASPTLTLTDSTTLTLTDTTPATPSNPPAESQTSVPITGIASLTFENGSLKFLSQNTSGAGAGAEAEAGKPLSVSTATVSEVILNSGATLTSSGTSSLELKTLKAKESEEDAENKGLYTLKITDGTFTLKEEVAGNAIGEIFLGEEQDKKGGHLVLMSSATGATGISKEPKANTHNALILKGNLTTFGNSSIEASSFDFSNQTGAEGEEKTNYKISVSNGELALIQNSATQKLNTTTDFTLKNTLTLQDGTLGFYSGSQASKTLASATFAPETSIDSYGASTISGSNVVFQGNTINVQSGSLQVYGVSGGALVGNVFIGDRGQLSFYTQNLNNNPNTLQSLYLIENKSITFGANVGYVSESEPLGKGQFGSISAYSVEFAGDSTKENKLINISINGAPKTRNAQDESYFALREGSHTLISTQNGIKKKSSQAGGSAGALAENITLEDIATSTGSFTTLTLIPKLITQGDFVKDLVLDLRVSQKTSSEILESVQTPEQKEQMQNLLSQGNNQSIIDSVLQSQNNALKVGLSMYISQGNVGVVSTVLNYINQTFGNFSQSIYSSNEMLKEIAMIRLSNTESRMVQGGNPFVAKNALASLLQEASKQRYASNELNLFVGGEEQKEGVGTLWATYDGAINIGNAQKSSVNGMSAGYDLLLGENKEYLFGVFASYGYGTYSTATLQNTSHNIGLGLYTRMYLGNNEVDLSLAQNIGLNQMQTQVGSNTSIPASYLNQKLNYNFYTTELQAKYGYMFKVGNEESPYYFKPFGGVNFFFAYNGESQGDGEAPIGMSGITNFRLDVVFGVEMRKYLNATTYFYLLPLLEKSLFNDGSDIKVGFDQIYTTAYTIPRDNAVNLGIYAGGQGNVTDQLSIMGGAGFKASVDQKDILTNWNVGLKYKF